MTDNSIEAMSRKEMKGQIRQGDILLVPIEKRPPSGAESRTEVVLAWGEITGHAHRASGDLLEWTDDGFRYIHSIGEIGTLKHEDHDPEPVDVLAPGQTYRVVQQREWTLEGQWQAVQD